ncbi:uncharacterized protein LOC115887553 [Sitophilus oryzae]|uniref:Uncharacterized protein LOC115887553 n=1 Tax=Sitophilus oryzae TaxID=7048 RepID=A0A6J2YFX4_SITOR|nr:uncharacterized protein LOC115887553 [Sitophilus oryzae]
MSRISNFVFWSTVIVLLSLSFVSCDIATNSITRKSNSLPKSNPVAIIDSLRRQIEYKEKELQRAEKANKNFEKMMELVNILGQVDTFLTDRTRAIIKKLAVLTEDGNDIIVAKTTNKI